MRFLFAVVLSFSQIIFLQAQVKVSGLVLDSTTMKGLDLVSVTLLESYQGTQTDKNGKFRLEIQDRERSVFMFTRIGYEDKMLSLEDLSQLDFVYMNPKEHELNEVVLHPVNAYKLLQEVVRNVPKNYYAEPLGQEVFFRQTMHTNNQLNILEEAHFDILNSFRKKNLPKTVSVHKARGFVDLDEYADLGKIIANNIDDDSIDMRETAKILLAFNPAQEPLLEADQSIFADNAAKFYDIEYQGLTEKGGNVCHVVAFDQKEGLKKTLFKGVLHIDTASLAITSFQAGLSPEGVDFQKLLPLKIRMLIKLAGFKIQIKEIAVDGNYEYYNGYWVIKKGSFQLKGSIARGKGTVLHGALNLDFLVDNHYPKSAFYNTKSDYETIAPDIEKFKDVDFWQSQDIFVPKWNSYIQKLLNAKFTD